MKTALLTVVLAILLLPASANAAKPILNMIDVAVPTKPDGSSYAPEDVRAMIIKGCVTRRWSAVMDGDGMIRATLNVKNKHVAEVEIPYTANVYSVIYVSSKNLDYDPERQRIHRNYNNWVLKLSRTIDQNLRRPAARKNSGPERRGDIYTEILKLDDLRNRGLLTDQEFESEKRKLLEQDQ